MRTKKKRAIFICQITENSLKVAKCLVTNGAKGEFVSLEAEAIAPDIDEKKLSENIAQIFKKLGFGHNPVIVSLPRNQATCRYIKVPSQSAAEIEKIASLQAARFLPYPANELITGYQILSTDIDGYSNVNLLIVHKDVIERYIRIFKELRVAKLKIVLSSYGLLNLYRHLKPEAGDNAMIIDVDAAQVEIAIITNDKLFFSRAFKFSRQQPNWEKPLLDEINKTRDVYLKETAEKAPEKLIICGAGISLSEFCAALNKEGGINAEPLPYENLKISPELLNTFLNAEYSFANILGLGLQKTEESLNLLPQQLKEETRKSGRQKEYLRLAGIICGIVLVLSLGIGKNLKNKALYLKKLKAEINNLAKEAKPLEEIEKRLKFIEDRQQKKLSSLDILYELQKSMPSEARLTLLSCEEEKQVLLRGQTPELNTVFQLVAKLQKTPVFKDFDTKVRYATKKMTPSGETIDFEISCIKK